MQLSQTSPLPSRHCLSIFICHCRTVVTRISSAVIISHHGLPEIRHLRPGRCWSCHSSGTGNITVIGKPVLITVLVSWAGGVNAAVTFITGYSVIYIQLLRIIGGGTGITIIPKTIFITVRPVGLHSHSIILTLFD